MNSWFRSWHGAPTDAKWRTIARKANVRPGDVAAVVWLLLDRASQSTPRGNIEGYDPEVIADALGYEPQEVVAIIAGLREKAVLDEDDAFIGWHKHQPEREDGGAERAKEWRERKRTQANASEPNRPLDTEEEEKRQREAEASLARERAKAEREAILKEFEDVFWPAWPEKHSKKDALKAWVAARAKATLETIMGGLAAYKLAKPPDRSWSHAATWLNKERWNDEYTPHPANANRGGPGGKSTLAALDNLIELARAAEDRQRQLPALDGPTGNPAAPRLLSSG